jgi:hypothetical protein
MASRTSALGWLVIAGAWPLVGCGGLDTAQKDHCDSDTDCNPGRSCLAHVCTGTPSDSGSPVGTEPGASDTQTDAQTEVPPDASDEGAVLDYPRVDAALEPQACGLPDGTVREFTSLAEAYQAVTGRWLFCSGEPSNTADGPIEFTADQHWYFLVPDGSGQLVRVSGFIALSESGTFAFSVPGDPGGDGGVSQPRAVLDLTLYPSGSSESSLESDFSFSDVPMTATTTKTSKMLLGPSTYVPAP